MSHSFYFFILQASLIESIQKKIDELKLQEQEIGEEIKLNEDLGKKVRGLVERKANQTEFSKYELFIGELNKIVALLLSLTQRLHRYEQMLQDLDMSEEEDKLKRVGLHSVMSIISSYKPFLFIKQQAALPSWSSET